jgi:hypothetical protein
MTPNQPKELTMQYLLLIYQNEAEVAKMGEVQWKQVHADYMTYTQSIVQSGNLKAGDACRVARPRPRSGSATARR